MSKEPASQMSLGLFESTSLSSSLALDWSIDLTTSRSYFTEPAEADAAANDTASAPDQPPAQNFRLSGDRALATGWRARAADNLAAIQLAAAIEAERRPATPDEQIALSKFIAFGATALANNLFRRNGEGFSGVWGELGTELEQLVTREELASLARATQYAHYTPETQIRAIWQGLARLGFKGGKILEPGCGTGLFFALMPEEIASNSALTGIEMDPVTARIARLLHPNAWVRCEDFTQSRLPELFDLAIGNPPFSDRIVRGNDSAGRLHLSLHDYFIARSIERLAPGGLAAFVTSRWTMDKVDSMARAHMASMADLIGAIRLPEDFMEATAGTSVVADILFFQRRPKEAAPAGAAWLELAEAVPAEDGEAGLSINRYFIAHPEMVLGRHARTSSAFGPVYTCKPDHAENFESRLTRAVESLPPLIHPLPTQTRPAEPLQPRIRIGTAADGATTKEGSYIVIGNELMQVIDGLPQAIKIRPGKGGEGIPVKHARIIRALIPVRDAIREVLRAQEADEPYGCAQARLRSAYTSFVRYFGPINQTVIVEATDPETGATRESQRRPNLQPFLDDPDVWLVSSIEEYDLETNRGKQGAIFTQRVIAPPVTPLIVSAHDALAVTLHETGLVDIGHIAELLGRPRDAAIVELGDAIFLDPQLTTETLETWLTADAYLSGPVRHKLAAAQAAAALDRRYARNVAALARIQPEDLRPSDIIARLGAPWIPADIIAAFSEQVIGIKTRVAHTPEVAIWSVDVSPFASDARATSEWGTARRHAGLLLSDALNSAIPQIWDTWRDADGEHRELNTAETEAAKEKLAKLKASFETWVWTDTERTTQLARIYNDNFNNLVPRAFDGSHLTMPGASNAITLFGHQKRGIWRIIASGSTYIAHSVGAGKSFTMAAAIMEQKRLGLITKALMVVPGHCLAQASREFLILYPTARILVADETNFARDKRQRFLARAATAQWDCIIITHSAFKFIPAPANFERGMIAGEIDRYSDLLESLTGEDRITRKQIERMKEGLEDKLKALATHKDDMLTIAELGIDQIIVDEAQEFRKLSFPTKMTTLKGIDPDGSQRAWNLYVQSRFIETKNPRRSLILASGTPITNTLGEMFTLQRFMQPTALEERGIHQFDAWAANFGETRTELELQPSGLYKPVTRFSEFVNVADLMAMYRSVADVVLKADLRDVVTLPAIRGGNRQIITAKPSRLFNAYQRMLAERIKKIEARKGKPEKGDDILLSVITDGRHAAIDMRFVLPDCPDEPENKLNALIDNAYRIWLETSDRRYTSPEGLPYANRGGAQMIFSDLGTLNVEAKRGFSAYRWIRDCLVERGVPANQIAFMQDYKKASAKQRLFMDINAGRIRFLIGSSMNMGTGVNAQRRLVALHHLDVPWITAHIEQREGRIERQGNQNSEIELYAYATTGSVDATGWQLLERKARFIEMAMSGDRSIRRLEDSGSQANQFAMAKALASGDARLMQKAGLEAEIARLERQRAAHRDDQHAIRCEIDRARHTIAQGQKRLAELQQDIGRRVPTRGDAFTMKVQGQVFTERRLAGAALLNLLRNLDAKAREYDVAVGEIGGFALTATVFSHLGSANVQLTIDRAGGPHDVRYEPELSALGLIARLEACLDRFEPEATEYRREMADAVTRLPGYEARLGQPFPLADELAEKKAEMAALNQSLAANTEAQGAETDQDEGPPIIIPFPVNRAISNDEIQSDEPDEPQD